MVENSQNFIRKKSKTRKCAKDVAKFIKLHKKEANAAKPLENCQSFRNCFQWKIRGIIGKFQFFVEIARRFPSFFALPLPPPSVNINDIN